MSDEIKEIFRYLNEKNEDDEVDKKLWELQKAFEEMIPIKTVAKWLVANNVCLRDRLACDGDCEACTEKEIRSWRNE